MRFPIADKIALAAMCLVVFLPLIVTHSAAEPEVTVRGLIDIVAQGEDDLLYLNHTNVRDSNFDPLRARVFIEGGTTRTQFFLQTLFSPEAFSEFRLVGAYLLHRILEDREVFAEVGLIPVHDGIWAPNTYSNENPLIAIPLAYYWKSNLHSRQMPVDLDHLLSQRGQGQIGVAYLDSTGVRGRPYHSAPMLYDNCWNYGAYSLGALRNFQYAVGVTVGSPSDPVASTDTNENLAVHAKLGYAVTPGLKLYLSTAYGAYLSDDVQPYLPAGKTANDYYQALWIASMEWQWRYLQVMGEVFFNHYDTPLRAEGLANRSFYLQAVYKFIPGWYVAGRYDEIRHEKVSGGVGEVSWDADVRRIETGIGYHVSRELLAKFVLQLTDTGDGWTNDTLIPAAQLSFTF